jgi:hypothetical protein
MGNESDVAYRIEVTLGGDTNTALVEDEFAWDEEDGECEFMLRSPDGDEKVFYGDLETSIDAMEHLKELGYVPDAL